MTIKAFLIALVISTSVSFVQAAPSLEWNITGQVSPNLSVAEAARLNFSPTSSFINLGFNQQPVWLTATLPPLEQDYYLTFDNPTLEYLDFYLTDQQGTHLKTVKTGAARPPDSRELVASNYTFIIPAGSEARTVYLRLAADVPLVGSLHLNSFLEYNASSFYNQAFHYSVVGVLFALTVLYLVIFVFLRDPIYLYYLAYLLFMDLFIIQHTGMLAVFSGLDFTWFYKHQSLAETGICVTAGYFGLQFLRLKQFLPVWYKIIWGAIILQLAFVFFGLFFNQLILELSRLVATFYVVTIIFISLYIYRVKQYTPAIYFLFSSIFLFTGSMVYIFRGAGLIPNDGFFARHAIEAGVALEMLVLSLGVSVRIDGIRRKGLQVEQENTRILSGQKEILKQKVKEKTEALQQQNVELQSTLNDLKTTQARLVQSEKMASVGMLTAGVAHELNNPLNFIKNGVMLIQDEIEPTQGNSNDNGDASDSGEDSIDTYLGIIEEGADRALQIVKSLNQFNRKTDTLEEDCDIHSILDNCLMVIKPAIKYHVEVEKNYFHTAPVVKGNGGRLHQAFLNILANAGQAIEKEGTVTVKTELYDKHVRISISDTGKGIPEEYLSRITDPFFTTKPPGEGTGLGMYITCSIINEHNGSIEINSREGEGTTIFIYLKPVTIHEYTT
jgi:two-component system, NtrC family, sensor kinase